MTYLNIKNIVKKSYHILIHEFNIDYFRDLINLLLIKNKLQNNSARVRISFFRDAGGYYLPQKNTVSFIIESTLLKESKFFLNQKGLSLGLYKENLLPNNILSTIKTNNKILNTLAAIYAKENNYNDVLLMNQNNNLVESISGNIFLIHNGEIITPTLKNGCVDGVMRKVIIEKMNFSIQEKTISLSDLLNAQEIFITNVIVGVQWCEFFKTKKYIKGLVTEINRVLNTLI